MNTIKEMKCPECGHTESFNIEIGAICCVNIDGVQESPHGGDTDWGGENWCSCNECAFEGTVEDFLQTATAPGQHTPGPWKVGRLSEVIRGYYSINSVGEIGWTGLAAVAQSDSGSEEDRTNALANARLIAAAPELLAALKTLADHASEQYPHFESPRGQADIEAAHTAIAKATGKGE